MKDECSWNHRWVCLYIYYIRIHVIPCLWYRSSFSLWRTGTCVGLNFKSLKGWLETLDKPSAWTYFRGLNVHVCRLFLSDDCFDYSHFEQYDDDQALNGRFLWCVKTGLFGKEATWRNVSIETQRRMYGTCSCSCYKFYILADEFDTLSILYIPVLFSIPRNSCARIGTFLHLILLKGLIFNWGNDFNSRFSTQAKSVPN